MCFSLCLNVLCLIFADRDERNDRPTRQRAVQYINNTDRWSSSYWSSRKGPPDTCRCHIFKWRHCCQDVVVFKNILKQKFTCH